VRGNPPTSVVSVPQMTPTVKPLLPLAVLPAGVQVTTDGLCLEKRCPACGGTIRAENTPQAVAWIAARSRVCRGCDEDMRDNNLWWRP